VKNECIIVPYHYVHNPSNSFPKVYTKTIKEFKDQIDYLSKNYDIISLTDYISFLNGTKKIPEKTCILTFDDGLLDHYKNVYPILKKKHLPATFFVSVQPLLEFKLLNVQMLQILLAEVDIDILIKEYKKTLLRKYPKLYENYSVKPKKDIRLYLWYSPKVIGLKETLRKMDSEIQRDILKTLFKNFIGNEEEYWEKIYMKWCHLQELSNNKFEIGCHGFSHTVLSKLNGELLNLELLVSKRYLENIIKEKITSFSIPYGSYNKNVIDKIKWAGYKCCLNSIFKVNKGNVDSFNLTRIDPMLIGDKI